MGFWNGVGCRLIKVNNILDQVQMGSQQKMETGGGLSGNNFHPGVRQCLERVEMKDRRGFLEKVAAVGCLVHLDRCCEFVVGEK